MDTTQNTTSTTAAPADNPAGPNVAGADAVPSAEQASGEATARSGMSLIAQGVTMTARSTVRGLKARAPRRPARPTTVAATTGSGTFELTPMSHRIKRLVFAGLFIALACATVLNEPLNKAIDAVHQATTPVITVNYVPAPPAAQTPPKK